MKLTGLLWGDTTSDEAMEALVSATIKIGPKRIQLSRRKGFRLPEGAVSVARPTRWGNPFLLGDAGRAYPGLTIEQLHAMVVSQFRDLIAADQPITLSVLQPDGSRLPVAYTYPTRAEIRAALHGRDLACWCPAGLPCHADPLLEAAR